MAATTRFGDVIEGGTGDDAITGGAGNDSISDIQGGFTDDTDIVDAGTGVDVVNVVDGDGNDQIDVSQSTTPGVTRDVGDTVAP